MSMKQLYCVSNLVKDRSSGLRVRVWKQTLPLKLTKCLSPTCFHGNTNINEKSNMFQTFQPSNSTSKWCEKTVYQIWWRSVMLFESSGLRYMSDIHKILKDHYSLDITFTFKNIGLQEGFLDLYQLYLKNIPV